MSSIEIIGGMRLKGEVKIQGSKNAALPIIAATILNKGITVLKNCPKILDVLHMIKILEELGCDTSWDGDTLYVDSTTLLAPIVSEESVRKMRSSILFLGSLLGRCHEATIAYPGGCSIGKRPIDYHLNAFRKMNVEETFTGSDNHIIYCKTNQIIGNDIFLEFPSVGATQNIILAAVLAKGVTRIFNAAREPEVTELCNYLIKAGAKIYGRGTSFIKVEGVQSLHDVEFTLSSDRIVAGTYMTAVAASQGDVVLRATPVRHLDSVIRLLKRIGCNIAITEENVRISNYGKLKPVVGLSTRPYPGFPTDMQSQMLSVLCLADGQSTILEEIFESRFQNVNELKKMGADIKLDSRYNKAIVTGVDKLSGATVTSHDLRGGAALVIAGLAAEGKTIVQNTTNIDRGYEDICRDLSELGANVQCRVEIAS